MSTKSKRKLKVRTVKKRIINNNKSKGVKYTVEPLEAKTNHRTIDGDIFKKYINGVLVKQVFVSKNKLVGLIEKLKKTIGIKVGGKIPEGLSRELSRDGPQQIEISDKTTFGQTIKSGFGTGFGLTLGWGMAEGLMNLLFDNN